MNIRLFAVSAAVAPWLLLGLGCCGNGDYSGRSAMPPTLYSRAASGKGEVYGDLVYRTGDSWTNSKAVTMVSSCGTPSYGFRTTPKSCSPCVVPSAPSRIQAPAFVPPPSLPPAKPAPSSCGPAVCPPAVLTGSDAEAKGNLSAIYTMEEKDFAAPPPEALQVETVGVFENVPETAAPAPDATNYEPVTAPAAPIAVPVDAEPLVVAPVETAAKSEPDVSMPGSSDLDALSALQIDVAPSVQPPMVKTGAKANAVPEPAPTESKLVEPAPEPAPSVPPAAVPEDIIEKDLAPPVLEQKALEAVDPVDAKAEKTEKPLVESVEAAEAATPAAPAESVASIASEAAATDAMPALSEAESKALEESISESNRRIGELPGDLRDGADEAADEKVLSQAPATIANASLPAVEMPPELK